MKINLLIFLIFISFLSFSQSIKSKRVPPEAKTMFNSMYPNAKDITWTKQGKLYAAEFTDKENKSTSVLFDNKGKLQNIITFIELNELPKEAITYLDKNYKRKSIGEISKVKDDKGAITYSVEIKNIGVIFDEGGKFIRINK